jgi:hypothetical protein
MKFGECLLPFSSEYFVKIKMCVKIRLHKLQFDMLFYVGLKLRLHRAGNNTDLQCLRIFGTKMEEILRKWKNPK